MIAIESLGHNALYLDHNRLINESYNANALKSTGYHLKSQLFCFKPRGLTIDVTNGRKKKRKVASISSLDTLDLKDTCNSLLAKLKETTDAFTKGPTDETINRVWEEPTVFPQLKGANPTNQFQKFIFKDNEYLIPPHCQFFNHDLVTLKEISSSLDSYDFVVMDPPWRNKYIRRIKKAKPELGYQMMRNDLLSDIALGEFIHCDSIVAIWCTNSQQHQQALLEEFLPRWDLSLLHKIVWLKLNTEGNLIGEINDGDKKQPYEVLFIARHKDNLKDFSELKRIEFLLSVPSIIHSHKPPILEVFRNVLPKKTNCLELFARYLQPGFTSIGLEVLKLMDARLYTQTETKS